MSYDHVTQGNPRPDGRQRTALLIGAAVNGVMAVVLLLLAWLYDCLQMVHLLLGLISGGTSIMMARAAGDPGGDTGTQGGSTGTHDDHNDTSGSGG